jgi:hypothetical protein
MRFSASRARIAGASLMVALTRAAAAADEPYSVYSNFDLGTCAIVSKSRESGGVVQHCTGTGGFEFFVAEDDLRFFVGFGPNGRGQRAFQQTLSPFNSINNTVEFRLRPGNPAAFAAILRYRTADDNGEERGHVLVVSKLDGAQACHMAYIDARANADANVLARRTADSMAGGFDCRRDQPKTIGATGESRM